MLFAQKKTRDGCSLSTLWRDEDATTSLEYALMLAVITASAIAGYQRLGMAVSDGATGGQEIGGTALSGPAASSGAPAPCGPGAPG